LIHIELNFIIISIIISTYRYHFSARMINKDLKSTVEAIVSKVQTPFSDVTPLNQFANKFNIKPGYVILAFFSLSVILLAAKVFSHIFVAIFGMLYPAYMSYKVLDL